MSDLSVTVHCDSNYVPERVRAEVMVLCTGAARVTLSTPGGGNVDLFVSKPETAEALAFAFQRARTELDHQRARETVSFVDEAADINAVVEYDDEVRS